MSQLATTQQEEFQTTQTTPDAAVSIASCRALFNGAATRCKIRSFYNSLPDKTRGLILIAGGMPPRDYQRDFDDFTDLELHKVRKGMGYLKDAIVGFDNKLGDVRRLKHFQFSSTH
ncbi:DUF3135 domain-containing protein [Vibrio neptunius]|uniref:hypothetical protein n=1 Tax=Vibrio neptunius TaxID=170651 RepID=UPI001C5CBAA8|nr:hypothetical protein [Vibrio neptunius]QXX07567.1 hypothetical protein KW548_06080 [Vibrio neptunius]